MTHAARICDIIARAMRARMGLPPSPWLEPFRTKADEQTREDG